MKKREISGSGNEILTKDIILDQISDCSSYGISRRDTIEADGQMLELWETIDQDASIDLMVGKGQKVDTAPTDHSQTEAAKEHKNKCSSSESLVEKELGMDRLGISKRFTEPLTNLQITVEDLERKVEIAEKSKNGKGIEFENVKGQLEEANEAITKL
ncbi:hypothetical protein CerSpe_098640 [Prunus speciosa]